MYTLNARTCIRMLKSVNSHKPRKKNPSFRGTRVLENPSRSLNYWQPAPRKRLLLWMANPYNPTQPQATTQECRPTSITKINRMNGGKEETSLFFFHHTLQTMQLQHNTSWLRILFPDTCTNPQTPLAIIST